MSNPFLPPQKFVLAPLNAAPFPNELKERPTAGFVGMVIMPEREEREERAASEISCLTRLARIGMQRVEGRGEEGTSKADEDKNEEGR